MASPKTRITRSRRGMRRAHDALKRKPVQTCPTTGELMRPHRAYEAQDELETRREMLIQAMSVLNDREKDILMQRRLQDQPVTLEELSGQYDVSRERIRQIEVRAFEKIQAKMRELAAEKGLLETA